MHQQLRQYPVGYTVEYAVEYPILHSILPPTLDPDESQRQTRKLVAWTDLKETLFNELHKQDRLGKRANMGFKLEAWAVVSQSRDSPR